MSIQPLCISRHGLSQRTGKLFSQYLLGISLVVMCAGVHAQVFTPAAYKVNEMGALTASIPIVLPKGTGNVKPELSVSYSSQMTNGVLGVGAQLQGLSSIHRCAKTFASDGVRRGVRVDQSDGYCLDGQRLLLTKGTYGADQSEYRLTLDSFSKIVASGSTGYGPASFKVYTKDGRINSYGTTTASRMELTSSAAIAEWSLDTSADRVGNNYTIQYQKDAVNGELLPLKISYGGNTAQSKSATVSVDFIYQTRTDPVVSYVSGRLMTLVKLLNKIAITDSGTKRATYVFSYASSATTNRSLLSSAKQCNANETKCLDSVNFSWSASNAMIDNWQGGQINDTILKVDSGFYSYRTYQADINNDGRPDIVFVGTKGYELYVYYSIFVPGTGFSDVQGGLVDSLFQTANNFVGPNSFQPMFADIDGDGINDLLMTYIDTSGVLQYSFKGDGTGKFADKKGGLIPLVIGSMSQPMPATVSVTDINGDGKWDLSVNQGYSDATTTGIETISIFGNGDRTFKAAVTNRLPIANLFTSARSLLWADIDGDNNTDLIVLKNTTGGMQVYTSFGQGDGSFTPIFSQFLSASWTSTPSSVVMADVNGDNRADIFFSDQVNPNNPGNIYTALSTGRGDFSPIKPSYVGSVDFAPKAVDMNGDGINDAVSAQVMNTTAGVFYTAISKGDGTYSKNVKASVGADSYYMWSEMNQFYGDINGDGRADPVFISKVTTASGPYSLTTHYRIYYGLSDQTPVDVVTAIKRGNVQEAVVAYGNLGGANYTKPSSSAYPNVTSWMPLKLVQTLTKYNAANAAHQYNYSYSGLRADISGNGLLGFESKSELDTTTNLKQTSVFNQSWPLTGTVSSQTTTGTGVGNAGILNLTTYSYSPILLSTGRYFIAQTGRVKKTWDMNGAVFPTETSTFTYDCQSTVTCYGNLLTSVQALSDGSSITSSIQYSNDSTSWLIGLPIRHSITSTLP